MAPPVDEPRDDADGAAGPDDADVDAVDDDLDAVPTTRDESLADVLSAVAAAPSLAPTEPAIGTMIGEAFRITARLGAGGMGVVYLARDQHLQRDVAIKVHRAQHGIDRLQREAVAMAQLAHPNVLTVHAVGVWNGRLWVAMEYVPGATLRAWLAEAPRSWREALAMVLAAGEGLAAAHAAGFVHRDFKPDNVLVGRDGRPRVGDFGLVRLTGESATSSGVFHAADSPGGAVRRSRGTAPPPTVSASGRSTVAPTPAAPRRAPADVDAIAATVDALAETAHADVDRASPTAPGAAATPHASSASAAEGAPVATSSPTPAGAAAAWLARTPSDVATPGSGSQLTVDGAAVGTPAYMAPEQFAGGDVDARADQFGFCVVLYEALYGRRPFPGDSYAELARTVGACVPLPPPRGRAPARLWQVLRRGLARDRDARYPDMPALLAALRAAPRHRLRVAAVVAAVAAALAGAGAIALRPSRAVLAADTCEAAGAGARALWGPDARRVLGARLAALDPALAADVGPRLAGALDAWTDAYGATATAACVRTHAERTWSTATAAQAQRCLAARLRPLRALVATWPTLTVEGVTQAASLAHGLEPPGECLDERVLLGAYARPDDPALAARVSAIEARLDAVDHAVDRGDLDGARGALDAVLVEAESLGHAPTLARALLVDGELLRARRAFEAAATRFERAYATARAAGADPLALEAVRWLIWTHGVDLGRPTAARPWIVQAEPEAERYGLQHVQARAVLHAAAVVAEISADYGRALELHQRLLAVDSIAPLQRAQAASNLAAALDAAGRSAEALPVYDQALAAFAAQLGPGHPRTLSVMSNMIVAHVGAGDRAGALALAERAVAALDTAVGVDPYDAAMLRFNHAFALDQLGRAAESAKVYEPLRQALIELSGPDSTDVADVEANLAMAYITLGRQPEARPLLEHALAVRLDAYGEEHDLVATVVTALGDVEHKAGGCAASAAHHERALAIFRAVEARTGAPMRRKAGPLTALGDCASRAGDHARALALLEEAVREATADGNVTLRYLAEVSLGEALGAAGRIAEARARLVAARALIDDADPDAARERGLIDAWLREHPDPAARPK